MIDLSGVHPTLVAKLIRVQNAMYALGFPMKPVQGLRTTEQQQRLYAQGRTAPGKIVTNADGIVHRSNHQAQQDGWGHAVDMAFDDPEPFSESHPWSLYGACVQSQGLIWGGGMTHGWHGQDRPHAELT